VDQAITEILAASSAATCARKASPEIERHDPRGPHQLVKLSIGEP
jgi:hypothetical protein